MRKIYNSDRKLVAELNEEKRAVVIVRSGCVTTFQFNKDGSIAILNTKEPVA